MNDLDLLTAAVAARVRALPAVQRLYPPPHRFAAPATGGDAPAALAADDAVVADLRDGVLAVQVTLAVDGGSPATGTARAVAAAIGEQLDLAGVRRRRIGVRIASVER